MLNIEIMINFDPRPVQDGHKIRVESTIANQQTRGFAHEGSGSISTYVTATRCSIFYDGDQPIDKRTPVATGVFQHAYSDEENRILGKAINCWCCVPIVGLCFYAKYKKLAEQMWMRRTVDFLDQICDRAVVEINRRIAITTGQAPGASGGSITLTHDQLRFFSLYQQQQTQGTAENGVMRHDEKAPLLGQL
jgi:hypothetical protein